MIGLYACLVQFQYMFTFLIFSFHIHMESNRVKQNRCQTYIHTFRSNTNERVYTRTQHTQYQFGSLFFINVDTYIEDCNVLLTKYANMCEHGRMYRLLYRLSGLKEREKKRREIVAFFYFFFFSFYRMNRIFIIQLPPYFQSIQCVVF